MKPGETAGAGITGLPGECGHRLHFPAQSGEGAVPEVSVVMAACNAGAFVEEAVRSLQGQTLPDWELVAVDDGSTDNTGEILDRLAAADPRIRAVHTPNRGVSRARNTALRAARGRKVAFLDADDLLHPQFLEISARAMHATGARMALALSPHTEVPPGAPEWASVPEAASKAAITVLDAEEAVRRTLYQTWPYTNGVGAKLYDASLWRGVEFAPNRYEDLEAFVPVWLAAGMIVSAALPLYLYRKHPGSFVHTWGEARKDVLGVTDRILAHCRAEAPGLVSAARERRFSGHFNILALLYANRVNDPATEARCWQVVRQERFRALTDPRERLKNRLGALASCLGRGAVKILARYAEKHHFL